MSTFSHAFLKEGKSLLTLRMTFPPKLMEKDDNDGDKNNLYGVLKNTLQ